MSQHRYFVWSDSIEVKLGELLKSDRFTSAEAEIQRRIGLSGRDLCDVDAFYFSQGVAKFCGVDSFKHVVRQMKEIVTSTKVYIYLSWDAWLPVVIFTPARILKETRVLPYENLESFEQWKKRHGMGENMLLLSSSGVGNLDIGDELTMEQVKKSLKVSKMFIRF